MGPAKTRKGPAVGAGRAFPPRALHRRRDFRLRRLVDVSVRNYADGPRVKKSTLADLEHYDEVQLRRAAWCCAYWSGWEIRDDLDEFGFALA